MSETLSGILVIAIFLVASLTMIKRWLPALLTLPIMALSMVAVAAAVSGKISLVDVTDGVVKGGSLMLAEAIVTAFFGGMISFVMQKSGVAESMVKNGAELVGDNPFAVAAFSMGLIALLFTSIGGLGAVIMVSLVVLPMLATVGVQPVVAGGIMLIGISLGGTLNAGNWVTYQETMKIPASQVQSFALIAFLLMAMTGLVFIAVELWRGGLVKSFVKTATSVIVIVCIGCGAVGTMTYHLRGNTADGGNVAKDAADARAKELGAQAALENTSSITALLTPAIGDAEARKVAEKISKDVAKGVADGAFAQLYKVEPKKVPFWFRALQWVVGAGLCEILLLIALDVKARIRRWRHQVVTVKWYAYLIPVIPLVFILVYQFNALSAFVVGFVYAIIVTLRPGSTSLTIQSMIQGAATTLPAVMLMIGIGILIKAVQGPAGWSDAHGGSLWPVIAGIQPYFGMMPKSPLGYVLIFGACAPLALYRGPLNTWGLGFGLATILITGAGYPAAAVMGMLMTVGQIQGVCDPTNTVNVWMANELRVDVQAFMWRTIPYIWGMAVVGLVVSALVFMR
jgi:hypothetical protein